MNPSRPHFALYCLSAASIVAAGVEPIASRPVSIVSGCYTVPFEASSFAPADLNEKWNVISTPPDFRKHLERVAGSSSPVNAGFEVFLRAKARISRNGAFGYFGSATREVAIVEVLEMRRPQIGVECVHPPMPPNKSLERTRER
jgi:hypothetical protein